MQGETSNALITLVFQISMLHLCKDSAIKVPYSLLLLAIDQTIYAGDYRDRVDGLYLIRHRRWLVAASASLTMNGG
jgi:hypothetical protein